MKVVILAGGDGTHLLPLTEAAPKPLLPLANKPLVIHLVDLLKRWGFTDLIFSVNRENTALMGMLGNGAQKGVTIRYSIEELPAGAAGALGQLASVLSNERFLVTSCSLLFDFDLQNLVDRHKQRRSAATMLVSQIPARQESGRNEIVEASAEGYVTRIARMNGRADEPRSFPLGIYCFEPEVFRFYQERESYLDIKEQLLPRMLAAGKKIATYQAPGYWRYLFTIADYMKMNCDVLEGRAGVSLQGAKKSSSWFGKNVRVGRNVNIIAPVIIGDNTVIEDNAQIVGPAAIGADCRVGPAAVIRESTIWSGASIAAKASVARSIITCGGRVNAGRCIRDTVVVKDELKSATVNLLSRNFKITTIASSTAKRLPAVRRRRVFELVKRTIDVTFALILIVMLLPLMGILALAIKLDSPGPVFFRQRRCGLHGREFTLLKYRSMIPDAHQRQKEFKHLNEIDGPVFKIANDPRVTGVGRLLRKLSLDEIPQLFNILRGDMSFVGPRPLARNELRLNPSWSETRLQVKPGLTGLWQISGRSDSSFQDWVALDTYYARNQNLGLDLKILAQTPLKVVLGAGAC